MSPGPAALADKGDAIVAALDEIFSQAWG